MGNAELTKAQIQMYTSAFYAKVDDEAALTVTGEALRQYSHRPSVAELFSLYAKLDGRPGPEEAWATYPKEDSQSAVVTREAYAAGKEAMKLYQDDKIGARMAFREIYERLVCQARAKGERVRWVLILGSSPDGRTAAIKEYGKKAGKDVRRLLALHGPDAETLSIGPAPDDNQRARAQRVLCLVKEQIQMAMVAAKLNKTFGGEQGFAAMKTIEAVELLSRASCGSQSDMCGCDLCFRSMRLRLVADRLRRAMTPHVQHLRQYCNAEDLSAIAAAARELKCERTGMLCSNAASDDPFVPDRCACPTCTAYGFLQALLTERG